MKKYEVAVVGAGIGGSGVAALLAKRGRKVLLVERNPKVGGKCTSFERDGFKVPTYVHAFARGSRGNCARIASLLGERLLWEDVHAVDVNIAGEFMNLPIGARFTNPLGSGVKVTLRGNRMYDFMDRLCSIALPRQRDFRGISPDSFDGRGNYTLGLREQLVWPEIDYDSIDRVRGMEVTIVTTAGSDEEGRQLLELLGMPFARR